MPFKRGFDRSLGESWGRLESCIRLLCEHFIRRGRSQRWGIYPANSKSRVIFGSDTSNYSPVEHLGLIFQGFFILGDVLLLILIAENVFLLTIFAWTAGSHRHTSQLIGFVVLKERGSSNWGCQKADASDYWGNRHPKRLRAGWFDTLTRAWTRIDARNQFCSRQTVLGAEWFSPLVGMATRKRKYFPICFRTYRCPRCEG